MSAPHRVPEEFVARLAEFPAELRALVEAEVAAGNEIAEIAHGFPAAPCGAYLRLARSVSTRPRESGSGLSFHDRGASTHAGEWHDGRRHWFVLEPPRPPERQPDMDAIRERLRAAAAPTAAASPRREEAPPASEADAVRRFRESTVLDHEKWHDGIGYDLDALRAAAATPAGRRRIEAILLARDAADWRDVEALAALDTPLARAALVRAAETGSHEVRLAVLRHAPTLAPEVLRTATLVAALDGADLYGGLSQALGEAEEFHPPAVVDALFRAALRRDGSTAVHCAALISFLHGRAAQPFDGEQRPFFLRFGTDDRGLREAAFRELCALCGVDAAKWLRG